MITRIIGIDFGTSSAKIAVKHYNQSNNEIKDSSAIQYVRFDNDTPSTPTLIREIDGRFLFGKEAESTFLEGTRFFDNLKEDLSSCDIDKKHTAMTLTKMFFTYLYGKYKEQFNEIKCDNTSTYISIPVIFDDMQKSFILEAAQEAGFPNVKAVIEPLAAIRGIISQSSDPDLKKFIVKTKSNDDPASLIKKYSLDSIVDSIISGKKEELRDTCQKEKRAANILVLDMGASCTTASVCQYWALKDEIRLINSYSKSSIGGKSFDNILCGFIKNYLLNNGIDSEFLNSFEDNYLQECMRYKENVLSQNLQKDIATSDCSVASSILHYADCAGKPFPIITRETFEELFKDYISQIPILINEVLKNTEITDGISEGGASIDLVVLTGGHSRWYFVKNMLLGKSGGFETIDLLKIQHNPKRIVSLDEPQRTTADGLACYLSKPGFLKEEKNIPKSPLARQIKIKREDEYTSEEKFDLLTYLTGLDLTKDKYKIIYELYETKKEHLISVLINLNLYLNYSDSNAVPEKNLKLIETYNILRKESGFGPTECIAALKHSGGSFKSAMKNFYEVSYIKDEKEFQKEAYKMCLSKNHKDGSFPRYLISADEFYNIKNNYMRKKDYLSKGEGAFGSDAYFVFPSELKEYDKFYQTKGNTSLKLLCAHDIINVNRNIFSNNIFVQTYCDLGSIMFYVYDDKAEIEMKLRHSDTVLLSIAFNKKDSKDYLEIGREVFKLLKAAYIHSCLKTGHVLTDRYWEQDSIMKLVSFDFMPRKEPYI